MSWVENRKGTGHSLSGIGQHFKQGSGFAAKENGDKKSRQAFGDLTNQEPHGLSVNNIQLEKRATKAKEQNPAGVPCSASGTRHGAQQQFHRLPVVEQGKELSLEPPLPRTNTLWINIDKEDGRDPLTCPEIANDIMANLFQAEMKKRPVVDYMTTVQPDVTPGMRAILIDWLVEVAQEYKLHAETLYQAVGLVDRYLSVTVVQRNHLQLVGVSCMLVASKYEEIYSPQVKEFCLITEDTYTKEEVVSTEWKVLVALNFELTVPTVRAFLRRFVKAAAATYPGGEVDPRLDSLSCYIAELTLVDYEALQFMPSMIAASAVFLAQYCLSRALWNPTLQHYSSYSASELRPCVSLLHRGFLRARGSELPAIRDKYNNPRHYCVASSNPPAFLPLSLFYGHLPL